MNPFVAGVQYDDFKGTIAADQGDEARITSYLIEQGLAKSSERVVGTRFGFNENSSVEIEISSILCYLVDSDKFEEQPDSVRAIDVPMSLPKYFSFFKRLDFVICQSGVLLNENTKVDGPLYA